MRLHRWMPVLSLVVILLAALSAKGPTSLPVRRTAGEASRRIETPRFVAAAAAPEADRSAEAPATETTVEVARHEDRLTAAERLLVGVPLDRIDEATEDLIATLDDPWASEDLLSLADRIASVAEPSRKQALARLLLAAASLSEDDDATRQFLHLRIARLIEQESDVEALATLIRLFLGAPAAVVTEPGLVRALCRVLAESSGEAREEAASALGVAAAAGDRASLDALLAAVGDPSAGAFPAARAALVAARAGDGLDAGSRDRVLSALARLGALSADDEQGEDLP